ncbi:MAG: hypothetical protein H7210_10885 [Pyrinomonadaceae bacterium]|nr:hypothetical protein [Phycisphaerales bacterium]
MSLASAAVGAAIGAALGGAIWAAIGHFTGYEVGIAAWGVGALAGFGALTASRGNVNAGSGVIAAVFAVLAILGAKYLVIYTLLEQMNVAADSELNSYQYTDEDLKEHLAGKIVAEKLAAGQDIAWRNGADEDQAEWPQDYPVEIAAEAGKQFAKLSTQERTTQKTAIEQEVRASIQEFSKTYKPTLQWELFKASFGLFDLLWIGLAVASAYRIGSSEDA